LKMKSFVCILAAVLVISTVALGRRNIGDKVGVKVSVTQNALTYLKDEMLPAAEAAALAAVIPDMEEEVHVPVVGNVELSLKDMKINRLSVLNSSIHLNSGNAITVSVTGLDLDITLNWHYRESNWPHISDSGSGEGSTGHAAGSLAIVVGSDTTGHPTAKITSCSFDLSDLSIKLHGGASWLYDAVINIFHKRIVKALDEGLCNVLTGNVQKSLDQFLAQVPVQHVLGDHIALDYSLADPYGIVITPDQLVIGSVAGEFFPQGGQPGNAPGQPVAMPDSVTNTQFQIFISDFTVESLGFTAVTGGLAEMLITKDMAPSLAKDFFTTDFYGQYAPGLIDKYGSGTDVSLFLAIHQVPDVIFSVKDEIDVQAGVEMTVRANNSAGSFEDAFTLLLTCNIDGDAEVNSTVIYGQLSAVDISASLVQSQVGTVDINGFNDLIEFALSMGLDAVNAILAHGAPLPTLPGAEFVNPTILYRDDYIVVATDIHFDNPSHN